MEIHIQNLEHDKLYVTLECSIHFLEKMIEIYNKCLFDEKKMSFRIKLGCCEQLQGGESLGDV